MSDDLVFRLKQMEEFFHLDHHSIKKISREAAHRIEKLGRANDDLADEFTTAASLLRQGDIRIEKLEAALREIGRTFLAEVKSKPEQWTSKQSLLLSHEQAVEVHEELGRRILIARKALEGKDD